MVAPADLAVPGMALVTVSAIVDPLDLSGPRDACGPDCERFVAKWQAWWDSAFSETNAPAMLTTPSTRDAYRQLIGPKSRNMLAKAARNGVYFADFDHDAHLDAIHEINRSMPVRSGGPMRPAYMIRPPAIGPTPRLCERHRHHWLGGWAPDWKRNAHDLKLIAYCHLVVVNELAVINTILAHGDHLDTGVMNALIDEIARRSTDDGTIRFTNYLTMHGPAGLTRFKRSVGFVTTPIERRTDG
jgi:hypothetical protein